MESLDWDKQKGFGYISMYGFLYLITVNRVSKLDLLGNVVKIDMFDCRITKFTVENKDEGIVQLTQPKLDGLSFDDEANANANASGDGLISNFIIIQLGSEMDA